MKFLSYNTFRGKMVLWFALSMFLIGAAVTAISLLIGNSIIQDDMKKDLKNTVDANALEVFAGEPASSAGEEFTSLIYNGRKINIEAGFRSQVDGVYSVLSDESGTALYGSEIDELNTVPASENTVGRVDISSGRYFVYDRKLYGNGLDGLMIRGAVSIRESNILTESIVRISLWMIPIMAILAMIVGSILVGHFISPINKISQTADRIRRGEDLTARIDIGRGNDELHQLTESFNAMLDRIETSFKSEQQFTSDASHELRTPIAVVLSQCELSLEAPQPAAEYIEALELIQRQSKKMSEMVSDMLDFTRLEQRGDSVEKTAVDLSSLAQDTCEDMALMRTKNITITQDIDPGIYVLGDATLLTQLIMNLISNAYRYGKENGHTTVHLHRRGKKAVLSVEDDGIGIEREHFGQLWDRFYQVDTSRSSGGTGLGLSIVRQIARMHGGQMGVESTPGVGSTFTFTVPAIKKGRQ